MSVLNNLLPDPDDVIEEAEETASDAADTATDAAADATGFDDFRSRDYVQEKQEKYNDIDGTGAFDRLNRVNTATQVGMDFLLDNPEASVQEGAQEAGMHVYGADTDDELARDIQSDIKTGEEMAYNQIEGGAFDNPVTHGFADLANATVGESLRQGFKMGTGINVEAENPTGEDNTNFVEGMEAAIGVLDIAGISGLGRAAASKAGTTALRNAGRLSRPNMSFLSALTKSDEIVQSVGRYGDDLISGVRTGDSAATTATRTGDNIPTLSDETAKLFDNTPVTLGDDAAEAGARTGDDATRFTDTTVDAAEAGARTGDEAAQSADNLLTRAGNKIPDVNLTKTATIGAGGSLLTGAGLEMAGAFDGDGSGETPDPDAPDSATQPQMFMQQVSKLDGAVLFEVLHGTSSSASTKGFAVFLGSKNGEAYALTTDGEAVATGISPSALSSGNEVLTPRFDGRTTAKSTFQSYLENSGSGNDGSGSGSGNEQTNWGKWRKVRELPYNWVLFGRTAQASDKAQYLVVGMYEGTEHYLYPDGTAKTEPHAYTGMNGVQSALDAFANRLGKDDDTTRPSSNDPSTTSVREDGQNVSTGGGSLKTVVAKNKTLVGLVLLGVVIYLTQR